MKNTQKINCPICHKQNTWHAENSFRPFCSHRCKLIDLGEWANESRKIPGKSVTDFTNILNDDAEDLGEHFF
jgi:endogenous inhibitor of DNA gyrase (YacG/DUF329 family)